MLRRCYSGREPRIASRYGIRQWRAPFPSTRVIIKDPFALLSCAAVARTTGSTAVLIYRHPAAVLASYRRMGWTPDTEELIALGAPRPAGPGDLEAMATMWAWCHRVALQDLTSLAAPVVVSHAALLTDPTLVSLLGHRLGLAAPVRPVAAPPKGRRQAAPAAGVLHDFDRSPGELSTGWRAALDADEIIAMERRVAPVWSVLESSRWQLTASAGDLEET